MNPTVRGTADCPEQLCHDGVCRRADLTALLSPAVRWLWDQVALRADQRGDAARDRGTITITTPHERDADTTQHTHPGRRVLMSADGHLEVQPASTGSQGSTQRAVAQAAVTTAHADWNVALSRSHALHWGDGVGPDGAVIGWPSAQPL